MKNLNIVFEDKEYDQLEEAKGDLTWRAWLLKMAGVKKKGESNED